MKSITLTDWNDMVLKNCQSSYGLVVALAVLMLWESGVKDENEANTCLLDFELGLSGAQAGMAISLALGGKPTNWLDKGMADIMKHRKEELLGK